MGIEAIAHLRSDFHSKFGVPRQSGLVASLQGRIVFTQPYRQAEALEGLEDFSHLWLIWGFSANKAQNAKHWQSKVRPPRLGGNKSMGVFATRSPFRPNGLGLSCVKIERIEWQSNEGPIIHVLGADLMDGTPIYDIKPYIAYTDRIDDAICGFVDKIEKKRLEVRDDNKLLQAMQPEKAAALIDVLKQDPRPSYQEDPGRVYGLAFAGYDVKFKVIDDCAYLQELIKL
ncbi:MAG: tRNA (N6-threonylcarbamoyladenosine(37)-N6)-methyltransferase TrmO [Bacteroidales bacterium]|nr:tRNA (N6-threonylcarbamoyladenosine(37)-N6)-methyltransferase TrmO [Bacteroidales bacterium]